MERNRTKKLVIISLMIAMALILNRLVPATPVYHLSLDFLPIFIIGYMYGPIWAGVGYALCDTIGSILIPFGPYNPLITLTLVLIGIVYGLFFYKKDLTIPRLVISSLIIFLIKLFLTTLALWPMYGAGDTFMAYVIARIPNCVAILIAQLVITPIIYNILKKTLKIAP
ncbi:MAG: folate family ECF transporter S component [Clostridia bacterium]|nr:folate family ECF transporter S component [Clostridia bacterium]